MNRVQVLNIALHTAVHGGGTFHRDNDGFPVQFTTGFAVGLRTSLDDDGYSAMPNREDSAEDLAGVIEHGIAHVEAHFPKADFIGTWVDHGVVYVDAVVVVQSELEAARLAYANGQQAYYSFAANEAIRTPLLVDMAKLGC